jgi:magnesium transporter
MLKEYQLAECKVVSGNGGPCGIYVYVNPDEEERRHLVNDLQVDEHTLASALDPDEISRLEFEPNHAALIFKIPKNYSAADDLLFRVASVGAFLFKDRLIIILSEDLPMFEGKQFNRVLTIPDLLIKVINRSTNHFLAHLKIINQLSDEMEHKVNSSMENRYLINLFTLEKSLVYYLAAISSNGVVIDKLKHNAAKIGFTTEQLELLDDIQVENNQCLKQADIYSNILASLMDARVSIVSNNLNILMKTLNIITIAIMVPTLVVSAFSMNVGIPFATEPSAFWIVVGLASVSVLGFMLFWKYKKW